MRKPHSLYGTSDIDPEQIGHRIKKIRKELGLSQRKIAKQLGISQGLWGFYERGERRVHVDILLAISQIGDVSLHWLVTGQELMKKDADGRKVSLDQAHGLLLLGVAKCGICGRHYTTSFAHKKNPSRKYYYYMCSRVQKEGRGACESKEVNAIALDQYVVGEIIKLAKDSKYLDAVVKNIRKDAQAGTRKLEEEEQITARRLTRVRKEKRELVKSLAKVSDDLSNITEITDELKELDEQDQKFRQQIEALYRQIKESRVKDVDADRIREVYQDFEKIFPGLEIEKRRQLVRLLIKEIRITVRRDSKEGQIAIQPWNVSSMTASLSDVLSSRIRNE
ncbi:recombinase zinc beta ribbon domain-containing protein [candidate division KSB1 bacterium]